ncbi:hypothetical protein BJ508DRAFT_373414 [Ascobolus immersus RN42]|uniref:Uncharacterized protein n=1 Tax=Ascobolus immersus RN42 TaxID=1160509 RepID=A0A3N4IK86_ASCIM|nr:hypothetical protein BJ508DRAFT_373414 [Ascobolus immersus RN42]
MSSKTVTSRPNSANWADLQERMFGFGFRDKILSCKNDLLLFNDDNDAHELDPEDNGYDTNPEDCLCERGADGGYNSEPSSDCSDSYVDHGGHRWANRKFVQFCKGNSEYPQEGGDFCASGDLQQALRHLFRGWLGTDIRDTDIAYSLNGTNASAFSEHEFTNWFQFPYALRRVMDDYFLFYIYILVPYAYRQLNMSLGRDPYSRLGIEEKRKQLSFADQVVKPSFFAASWSEREAWKVFLGRERSKLLRNEQCWIIEAYIRSELWELWGHVTAGEDISTIYLPGPLESQFGHEGLQRCLFTPGLEYLALLRSERTESLILRYLRDGEETNHNVVAGIKLADETYRGMVADYETGERLMDLHITMRLNGYEDIGSTVIEENELEYCGEYEQVLQRGLRTLYGRRRITDSRILRSENRSC